MVKFSKKMKKKQGVFDQRKIRTELNGSAKNKNNKNFNKNFSKTKQKPILGDLSEQDMSSTDYESDFSCESSPVKIQNNKRKNIRKDLKGKEQDLINSSGENEDEEDVKNVKKIKFEEEDEEDEDDELEDKEDEDDELEDEEDEDDELEDEELEDEEDDELEDEDACSEIDLTNSKIKNETESKNQDQMSDDDENENDSQTSSDDEDNKHSKRFSF
jgi:segregation and condensation protein B